MKRSFDVLVASAGFLVAVPLVLVTAAIVRFDSPGNPLFLQTRIGRDGKPFTCWKLRTMRAGTDHLPTHLADASRVTAVGAFLRRTKIDELPQLLNILRGEMSFVGPRPCLPSQTELVEARRRLGVLSLTPGITGVAQVEGIDMSDPERLAAKDAEYLRSQSLATDVRLILRTVIGREGGGDRVVRRP